jgi:hypothetical protein
MRPLSSPSPSNEAGTSDAAARATARNVRAMQAGILIIGLVTAWGLFVRLTILYTGLARPRATNIFYRLYAMHEQPFLLLMAATVIALGIAVWSRPREPGSPREDAGQVAPPSTLALAVVAVSVLLVTIGVTHLVMHGLALSMDEFSADFQARLFARGQYKASLPEAWRPFAGALTPVFVMLRPEDASWLSMYLPVYALIKAPFVALGAPTLLNPLLAAGAVLALAAAARRIWPGDGVRPWVAIALLVTSSEFLVTSGTAYSMPAHLCLNLLWLWLYLRGDRRSWAAALVVGVLAMGLHTPFPHALFVAPFLVRLLRERRWGRVASAAVVYGLGAIVFLGWLRVAQPFAQPGASGLVSIFAWPNAQTPTLHAMNLSLLLTWHTPILGLLVAAALLGTRKLEQPLADLAWGVLLTLGFYVFYPLNQMHGWGYRYAYQVLGSLALIGAAGVGPIQATLGTQRTKFLIAASLLVTLIAQLPLRLIQTERFVRPFAVGNSYVTSRNADVVLVHGDSIWYGRDLLRNDPFLRGQPVVVGASALTKVGRDVLEAGHPGRVVEISDTELLRLGMTLWTQHR